MDRYIRASGLVMYPYVFVAGPNKHDNLPVSSPSQKLSQVVFTLSPLSRAVHTSRTCAVPALLSMNPFYLNFGEWPPLFDTLPFFDRTNTISGILTQALGVDNPPSRLYSRPAVPHFLLAFLKMTKSALPSPCPSARAASLTFYFACSIRLETRFHITD